MKNMKVVITGGAGFIGSSIADELVKENELIIVDNLSTGKMKNIKNLMTKDNVRFISGSVTDRPLLEKAFQGVDYVFHQAAITSVSQSVENPAETNDVNINGTLNVLLAASHNHVKKVMFASSSAVYGNDPEVPKKETMHPKPTSPYAVTKITGEYYCRVFEEIHNLHTVCLRYFNVYGPRQDPQSKYAAVIPLFVQQTIKGKPCTIYGDGKQIRDFVFVKDVVNANILAADANVTGVFNVGTAKAVTIAELIALISELVGSGMEPVYESGRVGEVKDSLADISKAKAFGYTPKYDLRKGLMEIIHNYSKP